MRWLLTLFLLLLSLHSALAHSETLNTGNPVFSENITIGDGTNGITLDVEDGITFSGTAERHLSMRPFLVLGKNTNPFKPTVVQYGAYSGYSLPIFAADDQELFFNEYVAGRWDGSSNLTVSVIGYLSGAEDVNDDFNLSLDWACQAAGSGAISSTATTVYQVTNIAAGRAAQYSMYRVDLPIDWDLPAADMTASQIFSARLYRTAVGAGNVEMSGNFVVCLVMIQYQVDKVFKA